MHHNTECRFKDFKDAVPHLGAYNTNICMYSLVKFKSTI